MLNIGTNLKCDRLEVPDDPGCEPDRGFGGVPEGEGALTRVSTHHCCQLNVHRLKHTLHHFPIVVVHLSGIKQFFADVIHFFVIFFFGGARVCWPLLCLCTALYFFERCLDSNPESCRSKHAHYQLSHPSSYIILVVP